MKVLYSEHPASVSPYLRRRLSRLAFARATGYMSEYITNVWADNWTLHDRVFWLEDASGPFAWAMRTSTYPYEYPAFMVYVKKAYRRKGWGTYLYKEATRYTKRHYEVYGSHDESAESFYTKLGREDYN